MSYGFVLREQYKGRWRPEETRHYCKLCNCWMSKAPSQIRKHEQGAQHQLKKKQMFFDMRKNRVDSERKDNALAKQLAEIEKAAQAAYGKDRLRIAKPVVTTQAAPEFGVPPPPETEDEQSGTYTVVPGVGRVPRGPPPDPTSGSLYTTIKTSDGKVEAFREYRPPEAQEGEIPEGSEASKNIVEFYNKRYKHSEGGQGDGKPIKHYKVGTNGWGRYSEDKKYYRAAIILVEPDPEKEDQHDDPYIDSNRYKVRYTDYGNEEFLSREEFTTQEPALWMKPPETGSEAPAEGVTQGPPPEEKEVHQAKAGQWSSVKSGEGAWSSNERALKKFEKKRKMAKRSIVRADKYSGGNNDVGYGSFTKDIEEDDYGLGNEKAEKPLETIQNETEVLKATKVGFKKRGKKRKNRNVRTKT
ncbi:hypothetical protein AAMO2058_000213900 [Amorphochlora amoebiformis]|uniref:Tudor domain-containing protein n=1 Tax=Amorphochlora amoebiformis TaxID=1561963 RepID=A0A7S0DGM0_9EUKA|mmetsp:Transcript_27559/g.43747  ORF Transcript_27559/g.43747 Transcript_27559/m.43747 type:complete len:413 (+) Transcript_27559:62-1300(+)